MHVIGWNAGTLMAAGAGLALLAVTWPASSQSPPEQITTDTPAYCLQLRKEVGRKLPTAPEQMWPELHNLRSEGERMCDAGETRGGIIRLRRALVLIAHPSDYVAER